MSKTTVYLMPHTERSIKGCFKMLQHKAQVHAMNNMIKHHYTLWQEPPHVKLGWHRRKTN